MTYLHQQHSDQAALPLLQAINDQLGFIPNFYRAQSARPDLIATEAQLVAEIVIKPGALTRKEKEYIFLVCSAANLSTYCVTAHCEIIRSLGIQGPEPERIAIDYTTTNLSMQTKALLTFACKLNKEPSKFRRGDVEALRTYGYSEAQILEAVLTVGIAKFANYVAFGLGAVPDFDTKKIGLTESEVAVG